MKANLLDEIFRKHLKGQRNTPDNIIFLKDRIYRSLETKVNERSNGKWHMAVAILILTIFSSGYWHYEQQEMIRYQSNELNRQQNLIVSITNESEQQIASKNILADSLKTMRNQLNNETKIVRLAAMPTIIINQPIIFRDKSKTDLIIPKQITQNKIPKKQEIKLPELNLPVVYESENLANNTMETAGSSSLSKKISKLFNN
jgi:hypothetical protein